MRVLSGRGRRPYYPRATMSSVAARIGPLQRTRVRSIALPAAVLGLAGLVAFSLLLRTRALLAGFWIDEGL